MISYCVSCSQGHLDRGPEPTARRIIACGTSSVDLNLALSYGLHNLHHCSLDRVMICALVSLVVATVSNWSGSASKELIASLLGGPKEEEAHYLAVCSLPSAVDRRSP